MQVPRMRRASSAPPRAADAARVRGPLPAVAYFAVTIPVLVALVAYHVSQGAANIDVRTVITALVAPDGSLQHTIVRHLRLPRAVIGVLAGASLATAGVLLQTSTRNGLASPATLGVNAGAFLAVVAATVYAPGLSLFSSAGVAFAGGAAAALLAVAVAGGFRATPLRLVLAGVAVSLVLAAFAAALLLFHENETAGLFFWGAGTLVQNDWSGVTYAFPRIAVGAAVAVVASRAWDVLALGDHVARGLGQRVDAMRLGAILLAVFLAAVPVSVIGPVGFVGLVAPHVARLAGLRRHAVLFPGAAVAGATLLVGADVAARVFHGTVNELPVGVVTALIGTPTLIILARRAGAARSGATPGSGPGLPGSGHVPPYPLVLGSALVALAAALAAGVLFGSVTFAPGAVAAALLGNGSAFAERVVLDLRLPRVLVAALAGAALAASGVLVQAVVRNPLAAPDTLGVTTGAGLGVVIVLLAIPSAPLHLVPVAAFAGAVLAFGVVYAAAWRGGVSPVRLALVGVAVTAFCASLTQLVVVKADFQLAQALVWLSGSTYARDGGDLVRLAPWPLLLIPVAWAGSRALDVLALGDDAATGLGVRVERARFVALGGAILLAGAAVAAAGTLGFVGLVAPHAARLLAGTRHRRLLVLAALLGATLVAAADVVGRVVLAPKEIPSGLVTSLVGTPYFLWLLWRARRAGA